MTSFDFSIIASGLDPHAEDFEDTFFAAGCDDATIALQKGVIVLDFSREAGGFAEAVASAMADVITAGATIERIEPDYLVSLSEIARRAGLTRAATHNYARGERADGFPRPVARISTESALWDWVEVSKWLVDRKTIDDDAYQRAKVIRTVNIQLLDRKLGTAA
jgi:predicted DNA-binding transcriptional regulator AlpA